MGTSVVFNFGTNTDTLSVHVLGSVFGERTHTYLLDAYLGVELVNIRKYISSALVNTCLLYTSDAADDR